jgi:beta-phosphoglucomutase
MTPDTRLPAAIVFDMDGVLVDSNVFHLRKWVDLFRDHGVPFTEEELPRMVLGPPNDVTFRRYLRADLTAGQIEDLDEELEANFRREIAPYARAMPGVQRLLDECRAQGLPLAVASAAMTKNVDFLIGALGLRDYFREMLSADDISQPKPDPEIYLKAAHKLGVDPRACAVIEDSFVGIEAAKHAGMKCLAVATTFSPEELHHHGRADSIVPNLDSVSLQTLRDLFNNRN